LASREMVIDDYYQTESKPGNRVTHNTQNFKLKDKMLINLCTSVRGQV